MKITFLGSGHGVPSAIRYCNSILIEEKGSMYLVDAGAPVVDQFLRLNKDISNLKAVFMTHQHGDHSCGLLNLTDLCNWYFQTTSFDIFVTDIRLANVMTECVKVMSDSEKFHEERIRYKLADVGVVYQDENIKVTYFPTKHCLPKRSYAILVESKDKKALFTGDLSGGLCANDFPKYALEKEIDLLVCELAHFGIDCLAPYMEGAKTKHFCFNHVYPLSYFDEIERVKESGKYSYEITAAYDGQTIEL